MKKALLITAFSLAYLFLLFICVSNAQTWHPNPKFTKHQDSSQSHAEKYKYQCLGTTQKGERCKRHVKDNGAYCYQHTAQKVN